MNCKNCDTEINQNYCPNCGKAATLKRIDHHYIVHEITHLLHFEKGILYTIKQLFTKPGTAVRNFINEDRSRLVKPVVFIIVTSLVFSIISHFFHIESFVSYKETDNGSTVDKMFKWGDVNSGYANIIIGIFIALWVKLFFRKYGYNLYEILILLCFVTGISMIIFSASALLQALTHIPLMKASGIVGLAYCTWAIGDFFDKYQKSSYVKSFFAYFLGLVSFSISMILVGTIIDKLFGV